MRDVRVVTLHQRHPVFLAQLARREDEGARGGAVQEVRRVLLEELLDTGVAREGQQQGVARVEGQLEAVHADDLRAVVRRGRVAVRRDDHHVVAKLREVLNEPQEAVLHPAHVTERRRLHEDADAAALPVCGVERRGARFDPRVRHRHARGAPHEARAANLPLLGRGAVVQSSSSSRSSSLSCVQGKMPSPKDGVGASIGRTTRGGERLRARRDTTRARPQRHRRCGGRDRRHWRRRR
mmetsp:Transcript_35579/g.87516  ORF Transcript_35579/g.87516 Transcript_35579/m.87516 type:complete len:238 (+) Transcript_35579:2041-2754(+)